MDQNKDRILDEQLMAGKTLLFFLDSAPVASMEANFLSGIFLLTKTATVTFRVFQGADVGTKLHFNAKTEVVLLYVSG
jgi:hypothetical protein